jgi:hypothetical protein
MSTLQEKKLGWLVLVWHSLAHNKAHGSCPIRIPDAVCRMMEHCLYMKLVISGQTIVQHLAFCSIIGSQICC